LVSASETRTSSYLVQSTADSTQTSSVHSNGVFVTAVGNHEGITVVEASEEGNNDDDNDDNNNDGSSSSVTLSLSSHRPTVGRPLPLGGPLSLCGA